MASCIKQINDSELYQLGKGAQCSLVPDISDLVDAELDLEIPSVTADLGARCFLIWLNHDSNGIRWKPLESTGVH